VATQRRRFEVVWEVTGQRRSLAEDAYGVGWDREEGAWEGQVARSTNRPESHRITRKRPTRIIPAVHQEWTTQVRVIQNCRATKRTRIQKVRRSTATADPTEETNCDKIWKRPRHRWSTRRDKTHVWRTVAESRRSDYHRKWSPKRHKRRPWTLNRSEKFLRLYQVDICGITRERLLAFGVKIRRRQWYDGGGESCAADNATDQSEAA